MKMTSMALDDVLIIQLIYSIGPFIYQEKKVGIRQAVQILLNLTDIFHKKK